VRDAPVLARMAALSASYSLRRARLQLPPMRPRKRIATGGSCPTSAEPANQIESCRQQYSEICPRSSLGNLTPREFIAKLSAQPQRPRRQRAGRCATWGLRASPSREGQQKAAENAGLKLNMVGRNRARLTATHS